MKSLDIREFCTRHWQAVSLYTALFLFLLIILTLKLHTLSPGFTISEVQTYRSSESLKTILHHPINAPYLILVWFVIKAHAAQPLIYFRTISAFLGLATLGIFSGLLYHWHGHRVAIIGTVLLGTSGWFFHISRLGTPDVLMFGLLALLACGVWLQANKSPYAMLVLLLLSAMLIYVPGMIWLIGLSIFINWKRLDDIFSKQLPVVSIGTIVAIGLLVPLAWAIYQTPSMGKTILNLPVHGRPSILPTLRHIAGVPVHVFIYGQGSPLFSLGHLPVLTVFGTVMFFFGAYCYVQHIGLYRFRVLASLFIAGSVVISLGGPANIGLLVPLLYLIVAAGIGYLFGQWFRVFPKNPVAQVIGVSCIALVVLLALTYNLRADFVSWPNAAITRQNFRLADLRPPKS